ncbi:MAG: 50S ribosomal protein L32 [Bacteriovoracaceae bacterium]|jgi:large subunit ribosomal protein L32|nr:50S ribosomal protein L32 [Bacteriovoracaceae bacterium]
MAVPKKKTSVSRKGLRRAGQHHKEYRKHPMTCPSCGDLTMPNTVCSSCGTYRGKKIFEVKVKETEQEEADA